MTAPMKHNIGCGMGEEHASLSLSLGSSALVWVLSEEDPKTRL